MRRAIDKALVYVIGWVNQAVFSASRGRVVLYRFHGRSGVLLTITGPATPVGKTIGVGYLPDGDDYIVLATKADTTLHTALRTATAMTIDIADQQIPADITMLTGDTQRAAALLDRLLKQTSIDERHEVTRLQQIPIARLTPHHKPAPDHPIAVSRGKTH
ncbi:hypothetical protein [Actinomadura sp. 9N215]|uniref:hypothetical protein n=1 Tax=Actinomadura sp. 9N215 TaxID=3375150 RepID=UPI00379A760B